MGRLNRKLGIALILFAAAVSAGQEAPFSINESPLAPPTSPLMDYAGVLDEETEKRISERLIAFKESSSPSVEIGVAVVRTTGDRPIFEYSLAVARGWGIGSREDDSPSALLFIAIDDRKYFTQISQDLEDELPDGLVGSLQRQYLVPEFRKGNYGKGIEDTIEAYILTIEAKQSGRALPAATPAQVYEKDFVDSIFDIIPDAVCQGICCLSVILFLILIANSSGGGGNGKRRKKKGGFSSELLAGILAGLASGGGSGSSSGWSGGSSGWGGSSGGFGGFSGGGSFGGGGAGGSW